MSDADRAPPVRPDLVIGVGHAFRNDDGAGPAVARALAARGLPAIAHEGEGSALLDMWEQHHHVTVVDAVAGGHPGNIVRLNADSDGLQALAFVHSTHDLGLPEAIGLGRGLGRMPKTLSIIGIVGTDFSMGQSLSEPVGIAVQKVIDDLAELLAVG